MDYGMVNEQQRICGPHRLEAMVQRSDPQHGRKDGRGQAMFRRGAYHGDDSQGRRFQKAISRFFYLMGLLVVSDMVPLLKWFDLQGHRRTVKATAKEIDSLLVRWLHEHRRNRSSSDGGGVMENISVSGTDPISNHLAEAIACTLASPHVLKKAQEEVDVHVGKDRNVDKSDISNLVYLRAIVKETFLLATSASSITVVREAPARLPDRRLSSPRWHTRGGQRLAAAP